MISFSEATRVRPTDQGFSVDLDPQWAVAEKLHGGYSVAVVGRADLYARASAGGRQQHNCL